MRAIIQDLEDRIHHAKLDERDHKNDPLSIRRELAAYTRGLKDALFVVKGGPEPDIPDIITKGMRFQFYRPSDTAPEGWAFVKRVNKRWAVCEKL